MKIGIITDSIDDGNAGVGTYARGLATALPSASEHEIAFIHRSPHEFYAGMRELVFAGWGSKFVRKQLLMRRILDAHGFDLVHETFHFPPFFGRASYRKVMTIHDMSPFALGQSHMSVRNWFWHRMFVPPLARRADHVLTDSHHSRADILRILGLPPERVSVAYLAADPSFQPCTEEEVERVRRRYSLPRRFLLFVGTIEPRKNLVRLVHAFEQAASSASDLALVVAGAPGWRYGPILRAVRRSPVRERIVMPGRIDQQDLPALLRGALALVYPSLYEGFGLPPLEAMQCGCPVITSDSSSLPEVVGDAAMVIDPYDIQALAAAMELIVHDASLRQELRERGLERARLFSWQRCAEDTVEAYERALAA